MLKKFIFLGHKTNRLRKRLIINKKLPSEPIFRKIIITITNLIIVDTITTNTHLPAIIKIIYLIIQTAKNGHIDTEETA